MGWSSIVLTLATATFLELSEGGGDVHAVMEWARALVSLALSFSGCRARRMDA